jgi:hypothetical protein
MGLVDTHDFNEDKNEQIQERGKHVARVTKHFDSKISLYDWATTANMGG